MTYEKAMEQMPQDWVLWGNYGDGKWRAGPRPQSNVIEPTEDIEEAVKRANDVNKKTTVSGEQQ